MTLDPDKLFTSSAKMKINFALSIIVILYWSVNYFSWTVFLLGLLSYYTIGKIGGDVALHRYFCHRSFKTSNFWDKVLKFTSFIVGHGSQFLWVITHRVHHKDSDTVDDPHPPAIAGNLKIFLRTWSSNFVPSAKYGKDLIKDTDIMFIHKHYFKLFYLWVVVLSMFGIYPLLLLFAFPCFGFFLETGFVNIVGHGHGYRPYNTPDHSTNNIILNTLTVGNGMHNTHHCHQSSYTTDIRNKWYEFDLMKYFINAIRI